MQYYNYHPITKKYIGIEESEGCPAFATSDAPQNVDAIFDTIQQKWTDPPPPSIAELNAPIIGQLVALDAQRTRPLAEIMLAQIAGEPLPLYAKAKLADLELQAAELRGKLVK